MKKIFNLLTICIITLVFHTGCADTADEDETIKPETDINLTQGQKDFIYGLKKQDGVKNAVWIDDSTLNITLESNVLGGNSQEKAKMLAKSVASDSSFILERKICVNILYPSGKKLATVCEDDRNTE